MDIQILHLIEGAKEAKGLAVVIDVFRAFSVACYAFDNGVSKIIPVADKELAYNLKRKNPEYILVGERGGKKLANFDYGNSPFHIASGDLRGKTLIHTTSAGTQGIVNCKNADEIITGSFNNAGAIVRYIHSNNFSNVSLICMGDAAKKPTVEDNLCAEYLRNTIIGLPSNYDEMKNAIRIERGDQFFNEENSEHLPSEDFEYCTRLSIFDFVLKAEYSNEYQYLELHKIEI